MRVSEQHSKLLSEIAEHPYLEIFKSCLGMDLDNVFYVSLSSGVGPDNPRSPFQFQLFCDVFEKKGLSSHHEDKMTSLQIQEHY